MSRKRLATVKEACIYAKLGMTKLYAKINEGVIKAYKHDRKTLIDLDSIDAMHDSELVPWKPKDEDFARERGRFKHKGKK